MSLMGDVRDEVYDVLPGLMTPGVRCLSLAKTVYLGQSSDGGLLGKFYIEAGNFGVRGSALIDTNAGVSYGAIRFMDDWSTMYNQGSMYGRMHMQVGMVEVPGLGMKNLSYFEQVRTPRDFQTMLGVVSGVQKLYAQNKFK